MKHIDTRHIVKKLILAGRTEEQANIEVDALTELVEATTLNRADLMQMETRLESRIDKLEARIDRLDAKFENKLDTNTKDIMIWVGGMIFTGFITFGGFFAWYLNHLIK